MSNLKSSGELNRGAIGVPHIVFFVIAAAAPLTAVVGASPAAFSLGNGVGVPGTYLIVGLLYVIFSAGFTAMSRFASSAGGFYTYVTLGLGRPVGLANALVALATYNAIDVAVYGIFSFFARAMVVQVGGPELPWIVYAAVLAVVSYLCGRKNIAFSGAILGACMIAEISILALLAGVIVVTGGGPDGVSLKAFEPTAVFSHGVGISLVFVVASFIGFEATAIFGEEAIDPKRTVARATYISVVLIAVFYAIVTWAVVLHYGSASIVNVARSNAAGMYLNAVNEKLGRLAGCAMQLLLMTSLFASSLSFHNTANRYMYALGREGVLPQVFALTHPSHRSPFVAGAAQTVFALTIASLFWIFDFDPYTVVFAWMGAFASIGILVIQIMVSMAVASFFWGDHRGVGVLCRLIAPIVSASGLALCLGFVIRNLSLLSGSESWVTEAFPIMVAVIGVFGALTAVWMRKKRPEAYENLGRSFN